MGVENNPQNVDALNQNWPADGEPALEAYQHLQNIKRAVKARANTAGQFGVTALSSAVDSAAEDRAATPAAVKNVKDQANATDTRLDQTINDFDTSLADAINNLNFSNTKNAEKGHQKFPGGFKINWVRVSGSGYKAVTWESPFTLLACFLVSGTSAPGYYNTETWDLTLTGAKIAVDGFGKDNLHYLVAGGFDTV